MNLRASGVENEKNFCYFSVEEVADKIWRTSGKFSENLLEWLLFHHLLQPLGPKTISYRLFLSCSIYNRPGYGPKKMH